MRSKQVAAAAIGLLCSSIVPTAADSADEVWVCSSPNFPDKFVIQGQKMTKMFPLRKQFGDALDESYDIIQNNRYGIVAIRSDASLIPKGANRSTDFVSVYANV